LSTLNLKCVKITKNHITIPHSPVEFRVRYIGEANSVRTMITEREEIVLKETIKIWSNLHGVPLQYKDSKNPKFSVIESKLKLLWYYFHWVISFLYLIFVVYRIPVSVEKGYFALHFMFGIKHLGQCVFCLNGILNGHNLAHLYNQILQINHLNGINIFLKNSIFYRNNASFHIRGGFVI